MGDHKNKLLCIAPMAPLPILNGASLRLFHLLVGLIDNWTIDLVCPSPSSEDLEKEIKTHFNSTTFVRQLNKSENNNCDHPMLRLLKDILFVPRYKHPLNIYFNKSLQKSIVAILKKMHYDAIFVSGSTTYVYYLSKINAQNITCDVCDSTALHIMSVLRLKRNIRMWISLYYSYLYNLRWERKYLASCKKIVMISDRDKRWMKKTVPRSSIYVVPNGVDASYWNPKSALPSKEAGLIIFTGVMDYGPNHDAMMYCLQKIWPRIRKDTPQAKLRIIGRHPRKELRELANKSLGVEVTGEVDDVRKAGAGAQVFLCPIQRGSGMKNKILQALSMGIPVVSTSEGACGIRFQDGKIGHIADSPEDMAFYVARLVDDRQLWERYSKAAREFVMREYSWTSKVEKLSRVLSA